MHHLILNGAQTKYSREIVLNPRMINIDHFATLTHIGAYTLISTDGYTPCSYERD
jgi:hypothetical protein